MTSTSWRLPDAPLRSSVAGALAAGIFGTWVLALIVSSWTGAGAGYLPTSLGLFIVASALLFGLVGAHHPFPRFGLANHATLLRLVLVAIVAGLVGESTSAPIAWLAVAATTTSAVLDGLDGWLARREGMSSRFGARFDMETDAMLILLLSVLAWQHDKAGAWVLLCGLMRYGFVAGGWLLPWMAGPLRSTLRGKTVATCQLVGLGVALLPIVETPYSAAIAALTLAALTWSFAVDVRWLFAARSR